MLFMCIKVQLMVEAHLHDYTLFNCDQDHYFEKISSQSVKRYTMNSGDGVHTLDICVYETGLWRTTTHSVICPLTNKVLYSTQLAGFIV